MNVRRLVFLLAASALMPGPGLQAQIPKNYKTTVFDPQGSQWTFPVDQTQQGTIAGYWGDGNNVWHGFTYLPGCQTETIDVAGAGTDGTFGQGTIVTDINDEGTTCGEIQDSNNNVHGFIRNANGQVILYDDPSEKAYAAGYPINTTCTSFWSLADLGQSVGVYYDANGISHGFLRTSFGFTFNFDPPGAVNGTDISEFKNINVMGLVTGGFWDANGNEHGFLRLVDGSYIMLDPPGATGSLGESLNDLGTVTGWWADAAGVKHGFLRPLVGKTVLFDLPGLPAGSYIVPNFTNDLGMTVGNAWYPGGYSRGFVRSPDGEFKLFDAMTPIATGEGEGTKAHSINNAGQISGDVIDANWNAHGFVMVPAN